VEIGDGDEAADTQFFVVPPSGKVVDDTNLVSSTRQVEGRRPSQIAIASKDKYLHAFILLSEPVSPRYELSLIWGA
jgi:hypothetical protein